MVRCKKNGPFNLGFGYNQVLRTSIIFSAIYVWLWGPIKTKSMEELSHPSKVVGQDHHHHLDKVEAGEKF